MRAALLACKLLHLLAMAGFAGGLAAQWVVDAQAVNAATAAPAASAAAAQVARWLTGPSLALLLASGLLSLALRPAWLEQRWLWGKLLLTMVIAPAAWFGVGRSAMALALGLAVLAAALGVWRPRFGRVPAPDER